MWRVILEQQVVAEDLHRAAADVSIAYGNRLRAAIAPAAADVHVSIIDADTVPAVRKAVTELRPDLVFLVVGTYDPASAVAENLRRIMHESTVPLWILHAPPAP
jgi:hypothetical protein